MERKAIISTIGMIPVFVVFAWAGFRIGTHLGAPSSPAPSLTVYLAALASGAVMLANVVIRERARDRR